MDLEEANIENIIKDLSTFPENLNILLKAFESYRKGIQISLKTLSTILEYFEKVLNNTNNHAHFNSHLAAIIQDVIIPIFYFTDGDQQLWETNSIEFVSSNLDSNCKDEASVLRPAARKFLHSGCKKNSIMLSTTIKLIMNIIRSNVDQMETYAAYHLVGELADILIRKRLYHGQIEIIITNFLIPELKCSEAFRRANAFWVLGCLSNFQQFTQQNFKTLTHALTQTILHDKEAALKVIASGVLEKFASIQKCGTVEYISPHIEKIIFELLNNFRKLKNTEFLFHLEGLICCMAHKLSFIFADIIQYMIETFFQFADTQNKSDDISCVSLLGTIQILLLLENKCIKQMIPSISKMILCVFDRKMIDSYDEAFLLLNDITEISITTETWKMLESVHQIFEDDGIRIFVDVMPALYKYVTFDTSEFLSNPNRIEIMFDMCKTILTRKPDNFTECHAAKLLEIIILQCKGEVNATNSIEETKRKIDDYIPKFVDVTLKRLKEEIKSPKLRTTCLEVLIAALYYDAKLLISISDKMSQPNEESIFSQFLNQWIQYADLFNEIHSQKLCVLGLSTLISLGKAKPKILVQVSGKIMPFLILLLRDLARSYETAAAAKTLKPYAVQFEDSYFEEPPSHENIFNFKNIESSGIEPKERTALKREEPKDLVKMSLQKYTTSIDDWADMMNDEFLIFREVFCAIHNMDEFWFNKLTSHLTEEQDESLQGSILIANLKKAWYEIHGSKKVQDRYKSLENFLVTSILTQSVP